jgi:hypothetical protein
MWKNRALESCEMVALKKGLRIVINCLMLVCINWKNNFVFFIGRGLMLTSLNQESCMRNMQ